MDQDPDVLARARAIIGRSADVLASRGFAISASSLASPGSSRLPGGPPSGPVRNHVALLELLELVEGKRKIGIRKAKKDELSLHLEDIFEAAVAARNAIG